MFNYGELYQLEMDRIGKHYFLHASGMLELCRRANVVNFPAKQNQLGFSSLAAHTPTATRIPRYVLGIDGVGAQVAVHASNEHAITAWDEIMTFGQATHPIMPGKVFARLEFWAQGLFADLLPRLDVTKPAMFYGHGPASGVAFIMLEKWLAIPATTGRAIMIQPTSFMTVVDTSVANMFAAEYSALDDEWAFAPPANVMNTGVGSQGTLEPAFMPGHRYHMQGTRREPAFSIERLARDGSPTQWLQRMRTNAADAEFLWYLDSHVYPKRIWNRLSGNEQSRVIPWLSILRDDFGYNIVRTFH